MRVRLITMGLVLFFLTSSAFALIGPPTASLDKGQWGAGANYRYTSQDLDDVKGKIAMGRRIGMESGTSTLTVTMVSSVMV